MSAILAAAVLLMQDPAVSALPFTPPQPRRYACHFVARAPAMNGNLDAPSWRVAPWSEEFLDIEGPGHKPQPWLKTRVKMLWDRKFLYIGAKLEEPKLWATLTQRDSVIFRDNDFEVFLDPDGDNQQYVELEMNALNTVWDLLLPKAYRDGGPAVNEFDIAGLKTAVKLDGKLNDPDHPAKGWSATIAIPWSSIKMLSLRPVPPRDGDRWRINFSRVEWDLEVLDGKYEKIPNRPEHNWVWSPQWAINMHRPETWGFLEFQKTPRPVAPDPYWKERCVLMDLYYKERVYREAHGSYVKPADLGIAFKGYFVKHDTFWLASLKAKDGAVLTVREDSRLTINR
ncbi:MAG TPA: carbohydrate-binding family 9-like protein [Fimbriimonadaceae bacterium]|nr:carbohydrate-binding family 9-like protein [Fimbriimonadaceae bacterium]